MSEENQPLLDTNTAYARERTVEWEDELAEFVDQPAIYAEAGFLRVGFPILTGLVDGTFNVDAWVKFAGSEFDRVRVVQNDDLKTVLWEIPALFYRPPSLINTDDQPTLSSETDYLLTSGSVIQSVGAAAINKMIVNTVDGIDQQTYVENYHRAASTIELLNRIFEHYGYNGRITMPEGLGSEKPAVKQPAEAEKKTHRSELGSLDDGDEL